MNFGFSGPMADTGDVVLKDRIGIEADWRHRERALREPLGIDGGMAKVRARVTSAALRDCYYSPSSRC